MRYIFLCMLNVNNVNVDHKQEHMSSFVFDLQIRCRLNSFGHILCKGIPRRRRQSRIVTNCGG